MTPSITSLMLQSLCSPSFSRFFSRRRVEDLIKKTINERPDGLLPEHEVWSILGDLGFSISSHVYAPAGSDPAAVVNGVKSDKLVAKGVVRSRKDNSLVTHKTDIGALQFNVPKTKDGVHKAMKVFEERFGPNSPYYLEGTLFVEMMKMSNDFGTEMLVSAYQDPFFGPTVCYGFGGTIVEYLKEVMLPGHAQVFMPSLFSNPKAYEEVLKNLPVAKLAEGKVRGCKPHLEHSVLLPTLKNMRELISEYSLYNKGSRYVIDEIEVNPTVAIDKKMWALDGVMHVSEKKSNVAYISATSCEKPLHKISCLTNPKSVVVAGASAKNARNPGSVILAKAKEYGVNDIYALHPSSKSLLGFKAFPTLEEIMKHRKGERIDLLSVCIPAKSAGKLVADALRTKATNAIQVVSGGFGETEHGAKMQQQLHDQLFSMPHDVRPVMNGPNTVGNVCEGGINTVFVDSTRSNSDWKTGKKNACILCQSGAFMLSRISDIAPAVVPKVAISVGNQLDLSVTDFLEYYLERPDISSYGLYIEGLSDGEGIRMMNLVRKAHELGKAVIIYKAGRTQAGIRAAKGHTAAMAGDFQMFKNLMTMAGALVVDSFDEWNQLLVLTTLWPQILKNKGSAVGVAVVTNAGFEKCATADHLTVNGTEGLIQLPKWTAKTEKEIERVFKKYKIDEVVDISEVLDVTPQMPDSGYYELLRAVLADPGCDIGIVGGVPETQALHTLESELNDEKGLLGYIRKLREEFPHKPLVAVFESGEKYQPLRRELTKLGVASFSSIDSASRVICNVIRQSNRP